MYRLKPNGPDFTVVDGKFANKTFRAGAVYAEVPPEYMERFDEVKNDIGAGLNPPPVPKEVKRNEKLSGRL